MRINLFNKTAVSCKDSLDPGPEAHAGLRQGVPGKGTHHLLDLLDQFLQFVAKLCIEPNFKDAPQKIVKRVAVWGARRPGLLHPHLRKALLEPVLHPLAVLGKSAVLLEDEVMISSYVRASFDSILSYLHVLEIFIPFRGGGGGRGGRPAKVPGDELVEVGSQDGSLSSC